MSLSLSESESVAGNGCKGRKYFFRIFIAQEKDREVIPAHPHTSTPPYIGPYSGGVTMGSEKFKFLVMTVGDP